METSKAQQESTMKPPPQKEHRWLQKLIGEWTFEGEATMEPGKPPEGTPVTRRPTCGPKGPIFYPN